MDNFTHLFNEESQKASRKFVMDLNAQLENTFADRCVLFSKRLDHDKVLIADIFNKDQNGVSYPTFGCKQPCKVFNEKFGEKYVVCEQPDLSKHNVKVESNDEFVLLYNSAKI